MAKAVEPNGLVSALEGVAGGVGVVRHARHSHLGGGLSAYELEVLCWMAEGLDDADVAEILRVDVAVVAGHLRSARDRLGVADRAAAVRWCRGPRGTTDPLAQQTTPVGAPARRVFPPLRLA